MPNWTENELTISGPDVNKVLETIRSDSIHDQDKRILDFNRIIPYPQIYRDMDKRAEEYREKFADIENDDPERQQKLEALGAEYGVEPGTPWIADGYNSGGYEWACDNWMTKWNACHVHLTTHADSSKPLNKTSKCAYCGTVHKTEAMIVLTCQQCGSPLLDAEPIQAFLEFDTAWSPPIPVIAKLASMFPDHTFELKYFEGGMGFSGHARWSEGDEEFHHQYEYSGPRGG
ncbi:MAG TPA: hypothetical protein PK152_02785 [Anaerolineales bacterium]|nr:hypothetical protein [Anaerolineae bacterium]HRJ55803.1 hypothetical protein [Anaerolineales bacterium]HRK88035.1 hypothetical protein [Anaerolineales bacterium]